MSAFKDWLTSLTSKSTPIDADELYIRDSSGTPSSKKLTWANLKATARAHFDALYAPKGAATGSGLTMATAKLLGRSTASTGAIEEISLSGLTLSGGVLTATGGSPGGTVTGAMQYRTAGGAIGGDDSITTDAAGTLTVKSIKAQKTTNGPLIVAGSGAADPALVWTGVALATLAANNSAWVDFLAGAIKAASKMGVDTVGFSVANNGLAFFDYATQANWRNVTAGHFYPQGYNTTNYTYDVAYGKNAAGVAEINSGTAGTYRDLKLRNLIASGGVVTLASFTVATLPSASTSGAGAQAFVTDANATTARSTVAGGGSNKVNVFSDGTNWLIAA